MRDFDEIMEAAVARKGSRAAVLALEPPGVLDAQALATTEDRDWLAAMARGILAAGISWKVIEAKWDGIGEAFHGFDVGRVSMLNEEDMDALMGDTRVIRSLPKLRAIRHNAAFIREVAAEHGSFGARIGAWPDADFAGLLAWLKREGDRLGGATGAYALRRMGRSGFIMTPSVVAGLSAAGVCDKAPTSKKAWGLVQEAFNAWQAQSGLSLTEISRVLAQSTD